MAVERVVVVLIKEIPQRYSHREEWLTMQGWGGRRGLWCLCGEQGGVVVPRRRFVVDVKCVVDKCDA